MINYMHFRQMKDGTVNSRGGATVAYKVDKNGVVTDFAVAYCSKNDNYCRRTGRNLASGRLQYKGLSQHPNPMATDAFRRAVEGQMEARGLSRKFH